MLPHLLVSLICVVSNILSMLLCSILFLEVTEQMGLHSQVIV